MKNNMSLIDIYLKKMKILLVENEYDEELIKEYKIISGIGKGQIKRVDIDDNFNLNILEDVSVEEWVKFGIDGFKNIVEISYCSEGISRIYMNPEGEEYIISGGDLVIYHNNGEANDFRFKYKNLNSVSVHVDISRMAEISYFMNLKKNLTLEELMDGKKLIRIKANEEIRKLADEVKDIRVENVKDFLDLKLKSLNFFLSGLEYIGENKELDLDEISLVNKIEKDLEFEMDRFIRIDELVVKYKITPYKLQKLFKKRYGMTYYKYVQNMKMEKAKDLLRDKQLNILQISQSVGYENPSKFTEVFKELVGFSPKDYRNNI